MGMVDERNWPDPGKPGFPKAAASDGPHLIRNARGVRQWVWWVSVGGGFWRLPSPYGNVVPLVAAREWTYIGPAATPDGGPAP
jgi:hypothetical protein